MQHETVFERLITHKMVRLHIQDKSKVKYIVIFSQNNPTIYKILKSDQFTRRSMFNFGLRKEAPSKRKLHLVDYRCTIWHKPCDQENKKLLPCTQKYILSIEFCIYVNFFLFIAHEKLTYCFFLPCYILFLKIRFFCFK